MGVLQKYAHLDYFHISPELSPVLLYFKLLFVLLLLLLQEEKRQHVFHTRQQNYQPFAKENGKLDET